MDESSADYLEKLALAVGKAQQHNHTYNTCSHWCSMMAKLSQAWIVVAKVCIIILLFTLSTVYCDHTRDNRRHQAYADYPVLEQCCACDEAKYELIFEGLWSKYTHPRDFPTNNWLAHLGDIVGSSHSADFKMWDYNGFASEGVRELAEHGSTKKLESELKLESNKIRTIIKARDLWFPNLNSKTFAVFRTDRYHHLVSILSKVAPSPDWMVGVSSLELCQRDCTWAPQRTMDLYLWDAGTESSPMYVSVDRPTQPQERIHPLYNYVTDDRVTTVANQTTNSNNGDASHRRNTTSDDHYPNRSGSIQMNGDYEAARPFARLIVTRQRIYEKSCQTSFTSSPLGASLNVSTNGAQSSDQATNSDGSMRTFEDSHQVSPSGLSQLSNNVPAVDSASVSGRQFNDCRVTNWTPWTSCSVTCGQGVRTRTRSFMHDKAYIMGCKTELIEKETCESVCIGNISCTASAWSEWSDCSVSCGRGHRTRTRVFLGTNNDHTSINQQHQLVASKKHVCSSMELVDRQPCVGPLGETCHDDIAEITDVRCEVTKWSEWSPCSTPCGKGVRIRIRRYKHPHASEHCRIALYQKTSCVASDRADCPSLDIGEIKEICMKPREAGPCKGAFLRWYYDHHRGACMKFLYGGCRGNRNNFERYQDCERQCQIPLTANSTGDVIRQADMFQSFDRNDRTSNSNNNVKHRSGKSQGSKNQSRLPSVPIDPNLPVIDCVHSDWSPWSACSSPCGKARKTRTRFVIQAAQNGGKPCDKKLVQRHKCKDLPPCPPDWSGVGDESLSSTSVTTRYQQPTTTHNSMDPMSSDDDDDIKYARLKEEDVNTVMSAPSYHHNNRHNLATSSGDHQSARYKSGHMNFVELPNLKSPSYNMIPT